MELINAFFAGIIGLDSLRLDSAGGITFLVILRLRGYLSSDIATRQAQNGAKRRQGGNNDRDHDLDDEFCFFGHSSLTVR